MAESWRNRLPASDRVKVMAKGSPNGSLNGRVVQAAPVPPPPRVDQDPVDFDWVWIDDEEPPEGEAPTGKLWFDTNDTA